MRQNSQSGLVALIGLVVPLVLLAAVFGLAGPSLIAAVTGPGIDGVFFATVGTGLVFAGAGAFLASFLFRGGIMSWNRTFGVLAAGLGSVAWLIALFV